MRRETLRTAFTKRRLESLEPPKSGRVYWHDERQPGLCLCITAAGTKTLYYYGWAKGRPTRVRIGKFPATTIEAARDRVKRLAGAVVKGEDPTEQRRAARQQPTLKDAWEAFERYGRSHKRPKSRVEDERYWENFLKPWGASRRLGSIKRAEVVALHARVGEENGKTRANRMLAVLSSLFTHAGESLEYEGGNPCLGVKRFDEVERDRYLLPHEVGPFFKALAAETNATTRDVFAACLLTGQRSGNVKSMKWADVSLEAGFWKIGAGEAKGGEAIIVPLTPTMLEILQRRKETAGDSPWVFPGRGDGKAGHVTELAGAWRRICKRAGFTDLKIHDLRRSCGSWQAALGASLLTIGKSLGHRDQATTAIYSRLDLGPVRASLNAAETAIINAAGDAAKILLPSANGEPANSEPANSDETNGEPAGD